MKRNLVGNSCHAFAAIGCFVNTNYPWALYFSKCDYKPTRNFHAPVCQKGKLLYKNALWFKGSWVFDIMPLYMGLTRTVGSGELGQYFALRFAMSPGFYCSKIVALISITNEDWGTNFNGRTRTFAMIGKSSLGLNFTWWRMIIKALKAFAWGLPGDWIKYHLSFSVGTLKCKHSRGICGVYPHVTSCNFWVSHQ